MEDLAGRITAFTLGSLISAVICGLIWIRMLMRQNHEQLEVQKKALDVSAEQLAVTKVLNESEIRAKQPEIERTQRLIRAGADA
jgi:uncharacterized membrane protein YciS (DUF1049 family)